MGKLRSGCSTCCPVHQMVVCSAIPLHLYDKRAILCVCVCVCVDLYMFVFLMILKSYFDEIDQLEEGRSIFALVMASARELTKLHPNDEEKVARIIVTLREGFQCVCGKVILLLTLTVCVM